MSDGGEKTCPLCAEEMDLTDQQLKPCKCGYDICVWCWHQIMDMAEKDETEGRCPACRSPYNRQKIVGTAASCERLVSEMNVEKKVKSQKGKNKTSEGRKQLANVRVIQRNLVYVVGLPLNFTDEDLLQRREYFGQYGNVLKVSISRTAGGAIQQFANSTCSVYITYSKEEEALRCIQSVHGFILDDRPLRACFGTTKYCHAWIRNVPCSNHDCLYLHEIGPHEDIFTKDEGISAYTRSRVQQFTDISISMQRRSGKVLPPPLEEYCNNSSASSLRPIIRTAVNTTNPAISPRVSPPNSSSSRSAALPAGALWGTRAFHNQPSLTSTPCSNGLLKHKSDVCNGAVGCSTALASPIQVSSLHCDSGKVLVPNEESTISQDTMKSLEPAKEELNTDGRINVSESSFESVLPTNLFINRQLLDPPTTNLPPKNKDVVDSSTMSSGPALDKLSIDGTDGEMENIYSDILSMSIHENQQLQNGYSEHNIDPPTSQTSGKAANTTEEVCATNIQPEFRFGTATQVAQVDLHAMEDDLLFFDNQKLKDPEVANSRVPHFSQSFHLSKHSCHSPQSNNDDGSTSVNFDMQVVDRNTNLLVSTSSFHTGCPEDMIHSAEVNGVEYSPLFPSTEKRSLLGRCEGEIASGASDMGESSIISNILSMDFDSWDESLTLPQNLSKLLGERRRGSFGAPGPRKIQNSNQSRFSFAREDEPMSQVSDLGQSVDYFEQGFKHRPSHDFSHRGMESDIFASNHSHISSNKVLASRSQISVPPGFSVPSRAPPPGFTSQERTDLIFDMLSGNHMLDAASFSRNQYQTHSSGNISNGDIEFMDPAILAVGKGTLLGGPGSDVRSSYSPQFSAYEEARFQSYLQRSLPPQQNQRFTDPRDSFFPLGDAYGVPSGVMEQNLVNNLSPFSQFNNLPHHRNGITSNGRWDGWNEVSGGNNLGMAELLRIERLGFNKFYGGYEDSSIRVPTSGNIYNGTYGI